MMLSQQTQNEPLPVSMGSFCVASVCQMGFFCDADNFVNGNFVVGGDVLIRDMAFQLVADGAESFFGDAFGCSFSHSLGFSLSSSLGSSLGSCIGAFFADAHFECHVITLLLFALFDRMDAFFDFLDEWMVTDDAVHVIEQGAGGF